MFAFPTVWEDKPTRAGLRKYIMIRVFLVACILQSSGALVMPILVAAETKTATPKSETRKIEWGQPVGGQALSISSETVAYAPGERIVLTIVFKNIGKDEVQTFLKWGVLATYRVNVVLPGGAKAPLTLFGKETYENSEGGSAGIYVMKPGKQGRFTIAINRLFDFSLAGKYVVTVRRDILKTPTDTRTSELTSNSIEIRMDESREKEIWEILEFGN